MAPPELPGNNPVANPLQPRGVVIAPTLGHEPDCSFPVGLQGGPCERLHANEPLVGQAGLNDGGAPVAVAHRVAVLLNMVQEAQALELGDNLPPGLVAVESLKPLWSCQADASFRGQHVDTGQLLSSSDLEVERIVCRGDL